MDRREFIKRAGIVVAGASTLSLGGLLAACAQDGAKPNDTGGVGTGTPARTDQVIVVLNASNEPAAGFDPFFNWGCGEHMHEPLIQSTLINTTRDMSFVNDLATDYRVSDDALTWTFTIRDDVRFSDGTKLTARDVAFTLNGIRESEGSETDLSMVEAVTAPDDSTAVILLNRPFNALLYTLAVVGIVPEATYSASYGNKPVGSGRYVLEQWDKGQQVILTANPDYYGTPPAMKRVVVLFMQDDAALAAARSGQADLASTTALLANQHVSDYEILACKSVDSRGISLQSKPAGGTKTEGDDTYALGNDVTSDVAIRRALNYAVDRDALVKNVLNGYGTPAYTVSDGMPWASSDMRVKCDPAKAVEILEAAGWMLGTGGIREKSTGSGTLRAAFDVYHSSSDTVRQALANEFANQMRGIGIEVSVKGLSWDDIYPHMYTDPILWGWGSNSPSELYSLYHTEGSSNFADYSNPTVDGYLDAALQTQEVSQSYPYWKQAQWDGTTGIGPDGAATWVWFANIDHLFFKRSNLVVAEQKLHPHGHGWAVLNNVDTWSWK
ncbi:MAG: ABC transporter substrate-binding protein [Coriobacteriales bacterium]|jgi:peptide/nickel transport system substrate-binding protein|nr:ABC transporter substrate-binding protein [Coriobacteriales bacterium]